MNKQFSLTIPESLFKAAKKRAAEQGHRSVQEYVLQVLRDEHFARNIPRYERIAKELEAGKGYRRTIAEFLKEGKDLRKSSGKHMR